MPRPTSKQMPTPRKRTHKEQLAYEAARARRLMTTYGITTEEYDAIKEAQGGVCFLCRRARGATTPLQVDHDHALTGRGSVRGLLCGRCNNRLGWAEARLPALLQYINDPPARKVLK